ncbi:MAG TPA: esterase [Cytophagales bacterium]|nr:esterase [Cytophagales bacterium]
MKREYHKWYSPNLNRDMELLVFGHAGARVLMFPTRTARFFDYENWRVIESLRDYIEQGWIQVFTVDSVDTESFYCFWAPPAGRIQRHNQYENYILREVLPLTKQINPNLHLMSVGCSMGAYHAMNIALRHPQWFGSIIALSGRFDLTLQVDHFQDLLSGHYNDDVYYHMPSHYMPKMSEGEQLHHIRRMRIRIACGKDDPFYQNNKEFSATLWDKGVWHDFYEWEGEAHRARFWRQMLPLYI